jgi:hypothetical protein
MLPATDIPPVVFDDGGVALFPAKPQSRKVYSLVSFREFGEMVPINPVELGVPLEVVRYTLSKFALVSLNRCRLTQFEPLSVALPVPIVAAELAAVEPPAPSLAVIL